MFAHIRIFDYLCSGETGSKLEPVIELPNVKVMLKNAKRLLNQNFITIFASSNLNNKNYEQIGAENT